MGEGKGALALAWRSKAVVEHTHGMGLARPWRMEMVARTCTHVYGMGYRGWMWQNTYTHGMGWDGPQRGSQRMDGGSRRGRITWKVNKG